MPACVSMAPEYQGVTLDEQELCDLLDTQEAGAPIWNLLLLDQRLTGCHVDLDSLSFERMQEWLAADVPPITFVATRHLSYWQHETIHAVVVVGIGDDEIHVNDPAFADAPRVVTHREFALAGPG